MIFVRWKSNSLNSHANSVRDKLLERKGLYNAWLPLTIAPTKNQHDGIFLLTVSHPQREATATGVSGSKTVE